MTPNLGGWIHSFTVTDTLTHKAGYTIYKITSIVFPRTLPQALTCLTIWKRFHDIKRLHRELSRRHRSLKLPGQLPEPTDCSFFKRFDANVIRRRKEYILQLLDFAAQHPALYKCHAFTQFFSEAQQSVAGGIANGCLNNLIVTKKGSPLHQLYTEEGLKGGAIAEICDKLDLLYDPYDIDVSIAPLGSLEKQFENEETRSTVAEKTNLIDYENNANVKEPILNDEVILEETRCQDYKRFLTPMASIESEDSDYIYEAALEFSKAVQAEANLEFQEAHARYKRGVELLLIGSKDDTNDERKFIAKAKISKYLARADDIYAQILDDNSNERDWHGRKNFQLSIDVTECAVAGKLSVYLERPWNHLAKYKVLKILGESVMQVYCVTEPEPRSTYVMKGIEKPSSNIPTQTVFLPQHVAFMVDLLAFFQSEQKIFLLLNYAEGGRLYDYVRSYTPTIASKGSNNFSVLFPDDVDPQISNIPNTMEVVAESSYSTSRGSVEDTSFSSSAKARNELLVPSKSEEFKELVRSSHELLQSVSKTLNQIKLLEDTTKGSNETSDACLNNLTCQSSSPNNKSIIKFSRIPEASLKQWTRELAVAIHCLHGKGVILSDLHMDNLLLGSKGQLLLTYFYQNEGLSDSNNYMHKAYSQTALDGHYVAPERPLTFKSDWWSYGIILYELLIGIPFKLAHPGSIDLYGFVQYPENIDVSECAKDLIEMLLQQTPENRADYDQIQKHEFFIGTDWEIVQRSGLNHNVIDNYK
ncbi:ribosomal protein S6 kinase delta-1 isoform X1 [Zeugodacus cucurbitae]|uniref:ribosomal protein S6 kinase delta-1 isoform X1 n=1 Tax=Zeugodacus cucurbitae TaxID=28588 RepID=UPI0023D8E3B2|nr:ribosomal protein S6 kinase delta-1 isoform X1 [Zeugodacus cucurbitae]XP_054088049.1 ribosomal protein S6 kinase delta-1 isoform X1 [Zeugodacus cucurbitae]